MALNISIIPFIPKRKIIKLKEEIGGQLIVNKFIMMA